MPRCVTRYLAQPAVHINGCWVAGPYGACLPEPEDGQKCFVNPPLLFRAYSPHHVPEPPSVYRTDLLD